MSTWRRHRAHRNSRASSIAPPGGEGWTIRDYRAILHSEPYASADLGAASDVTPKSVQSEAASASSPTPISHQLTSDVIAGTRGARVLWQAASAQGENHDTSQAGAVGRFSAGSLRPAQSSSRGLFAIYSRIFTATNMPGVTCARCALFGAKTPWNRVRLTRGLGTKATSRAMKSIGSKMTCVVPSRYGLLSS